MPDFKFNLVSVNKLLTDLHLFALFTPDLCVFQDPSTNLTVATAPMNNGLYKLKSASQAGTNSILQIPAKAGQNKSSSNLTVATPDSVFTSTSVDGKNPSLNIIHARLGHTSLSKIQHIPI